MKFGQERVAKKSNHKCEVVLENTNIRNQQFYKPGTINRIKKNKESETKD